MNNNLDEADNLTQRDFNYYKGFEMTKTDSSQFTDKKTGDLRPGDHFWYANSEYRVIDHDDYEKMFGRKFPNYNDQEIIAYLKDRTDVSHYLCRFGKITTISVKKTPVKLYSLEVGQDFTASGYKYTLLNKGLHPSDYCYCIGLGDEFNGKRQRHLSGNLEVFPI